MAHMRRPDTGKLDADPKSWLKGIGAGRMVLGKEPGFNNLRAERKWPSYC
jgi:hypothetical protein